ncbi:MAG: SsrA-binding protein SmpB [Planctomycetota bacterium]|nr:SsrA-binding protein SmpB [Planctomycetota bacterium]MCX8039228.1 SsrA-binding protein SmpB [Planctomycetota bacterium]MDW8372663.1 SsrA-binding protein SmpB [Planctomycetota bacterium]
MSRSAPRSPPPAIREILYHRRLRHDFEVLERYEAGLVLQGSEVKSLRAGDVQWGDAHARFDDETRELWLHGLHIGEYRQAGAFGHQPRQPRKLLLHRRELDRLYGRLAGKGLTLVPERLFWKGAHVKIDLCLCRGKTKGDKRRDLIARAERRDVERELARRAKRG